jgi:hypothetical protein
MPLKLRATLAALLLLPLLASIPATPAAAVPGTHPYLLFGPSDVAGLRSKITAGVPAQAWAVLQRKVDAYVTPGNPSYIWTQQEVFYPDGSVSPGYRMYDGATTQNQVGSYLTDLSFAYMLTGDTRYSRMAIDLMLVEANSDFPAWLDASGTSDKLGQGDLGKGMAFAWDLTYDQWTAAERSTYLTAINRNAWKVFDCLQPTWAPIGKVGNNWYSVCGGGTGLLLLAIEGEPALTIATSTLLTNARGRVLPYLQGIYGAGGDGQEGLNYAAYGLHNGLPFALAWQRVKAENLVTQAPGVNNVPRWLSLEQIPGAGGRWAARNDSNETLALWQEVLPWFFTVRPDGLTAWDWDHFFGPSGDDIFGAGAPPVYAAPPHVGDNTCTNLADDPTRLLGCWNSREAFTILNWQTIAPVDPSAFGPASQFMSEHGLVDFRTGWSGGANEVMGVFEARHNGTPGIHSQSDIGQFSLIGYGGQWAVDSGYAGGQNNAFAAGHNLVTVSCAANNRNGSFDAFNALPSFASVPGQTIAKADLRGNYNSNRAAVPWADRTLFFSSAADEPPVLAVIDSINTGASVQHCWKMHTDAANQLTLLGHNFNMIAPSGAAAIGSTAGGGTKPNIVVTPYAAGSAPAAHTVLETDITTTNYEHMMAMAVQPAYGFGEISTIAYPVAGGNGTDVTWPGGTILMAAAGHSALSVDSGQVAVVGQFGKVTVNKGESVLLNGSSLISRGRTYVTVTGGSATVLVGGDKVSATGPAGLTYQVYAPQAISTVTVNGAVVTPTRLGDVLTFTA